MKMIPRRGYMWQCYGFTRTHIWGVHLVGGWFLAGFGMALLVFAGLGFSILPDSHFWKLIAISGCLFLASIATLMGSLLSLVFYSGASRLGLLENADKNEAEPQGGGYSPPAARSSKPTP